MDSASKAPKVYEVPPVSDERPTILFIELGGFWTNYELLETGHPQLFKSLAARATLLRISNNPATFITWIRSNKPHTIIVTDDYFVDPNAGVEAALRELKSYITSGGKVIFINDFDTPRDTDEHRLCQRATGFWNNFDRNWTFNFKYESDYVYANCDAMCTLRDSPSVLKLGASAIHSGSYVWSNVDKKELLYEVGLDFHHPDSKKHIGPITWANYGNGWFGHVDVQNGCIKDSDLVVLAMCGF